MREYYTAYNDRYRTVHASGLQWASDTPTPLVAGVIRELRLPHEAPILELGCGEGRDAAALMGMGYNVTATDVSEEAVKWCKSKYPEHSGSFAVLDCVNGTFQGRFRFIYSVAVLHMLTEDRHRAAFWRFIRDHLSIDGHALALTMGDGTESRKSDPKAAFDTVRRVHQATGRTLDVASTTCRIVDLEALRQEIGEAGLELVRDGLTPCEPEFDVMMYALTRLKQ